MGGGGGQNNNKILCALHLFWCTFYSIIWKWSNILLVGVLYGTTSVAVGHPFDTIKTKMQAQRGFENEGMIRSFAKTVKTQGIRGLYRLVSLVPSLCSSEKK